MTTSAVLANLRSYAYRGEMVRPLLDRATQEAGMNVPTATRPAYRESRTETTPLATPAQVRYLDDLLARLATHAPSVYRDANAWINSLGRLDRTDASRAIDAVKRHLAAPAEAPAPAPRPTNLATDAATLRARLAELTPDTRYALEVGSEGSNDWRFYRLSESRTGFRYLQVGHANGMDISWERLSVPSQLAAARGIAKDPREAMLNFGRKVGRCGDCGRILTNKTSREAGIGPICAGK